MAIPSTNIKLSDIRTEFRPGVTTGSINFLDYYRGGPYVYNVTPHNGIPTSGAIKFSHFAGLTGELVSLTDRTVLAQAVDPSDASAGIRFRNDGQLQERVNGVYSVVADQWLRDLRTDAGNEYQIKVDLTSGSTPSGTLGTWIDLSSSPEWLISQTSTGSKSCTLAISVCDTDYSSRLSRNASTKNRCRSALSGGKCSV